MHTQGIARRRCSIFLLLALACLSFSLIAHADNENEPTADQMNAPSEVDGIYPRSGFVEGGSTVRIRGKNLFSRMKVRLGGSPCTDVRLASPGELECVVPAHPPGTVSLVLQKPGEYIKKSKVFTYLPDLLISPDNIVVASGSKATFSASGGYPPYLFSLVQGNAQLDSKSGAFVTPQTADFGVVRVTDSRGFSSQAAYRSLPKLSASPESADLETDSSVSITPWGGEPPYEMNLISGDGKFFPDRRVYVSSSVPGKATLRLTDSIHSQFDLVITVHALPPLPGKLVAAGDEDSCAAPDGSVSCWGANRYQKKVNSKVVVTNKAVAIPQLAHGVTSVVSGAHHKCALVSGEVFCWGANQYGQLGNGSLQSAVTPTPVFGLESGVRAIAAGSFHTCAALNRSIVCWGRNDHGELGDGTTTDNPIPVPVTDLNGLITGIAGGSDHTCAIVDGAAWCWGKNENGQLGTGDKLDSSLPMKVRNLGGEVRLISAGRASTCAAGPGYLKCWGFNGIGNQAGGKSNEAPLPYTVQIPGDVSVLASQQYHSCAIVNGLVYCWGYNYQGQVGDTSFNNRWTPSLVSGLKEKAVDVATGDSHTCAAVVSGAVYCWGANYFGELGNGDTSQEVAPVLVIKKPQRKNH